MGLSLGQAGAFISYFLLASQLAHAVVKDISVGGVHFLAITDKSELFVWGANHYAQLGTGNLLSVQSPRKTSVSIGILPVHIAARRDHSCILFSDNSVRCWGENSSGQLGLGSSAGMIGGTSAETIEKLAPLNLGSDQIEKLILGNAHTCVLTKKGQLKCFGSNLYGALGIGKNVAFIGQSANDMGQSLVPSLVGDGSVRDGCAGRAFTCALMDTGLVKCWGSAKASGNGTTKNIGMTSAKMGSTLLPVDLGEKVIQMACADQSACAILESGQIKCWGSNVNGVLGAGLADRVVVGAAPNEMGANLKAVAIEPGLRSLDVACGFAHCCTVLENRAVKCWGANSSGQLGLGDAAPRGLRSTEMGSQLPYVDLGDHYEALSVRLGSITSCVGLRSGEVKCWGGGNSGQLGLGAPTASIGIAPQQMGENLKSLLIQ